MPYLASAVPLGLANCVFDLENIESAHAAGDPYPTRQVMMANGLSSTLGAMFGNPFPVTVYIGVVTCNQVVREAPRDEVPVTFALKHCLNQRDEPPAAGFEKPAPVAE